jgi:hypothetical protein
MRRQTLQRFKPVSLPEFTRLLLSVRETCYRAADRMLWRIANPTLPCEAYSHSGRVVGWAYYGREWVGVILGGNYDKKRRFFSAF